MALNKTLLSPLALGRFPEKERPSREAMDASEEAREASDGAEDAVIGAAAAQMT